MKVQQSARSGFSLLEMMIALSVMSAMLGIGIVATQSTQSLMDQSVATGILEAKASRAINRIAREVGGASASTLFPARSAPESSEWLRVQRVDGWSGNDPQWSNDFEIRLVYEPTEVDNGVDDDGDGLIDECRILLVTDVGLATERSITIATQVAEYLEREIPDVDDDNGNGLEDERGLCFAVDGSVVEIRLTMVGLGSDGNTIWRTLETSVGLRN